MGVSSRCPVILFQTTAIREFAVSEFMTSCDSSEALANKGKSLSSVLIHCRMGRETVN